jgi:hypothetical protein
MKGIMWNLLDCLSYQLNSCKWTVCKLSSIMIFLTTRK